MQSAGNRRRRGRVGQSEIDLSAGRQERNRTAPGSVDAAERQRDVTLIGIRRTGGRTASREERIDGRVTALEADKQIRVVGFLAGQNQLGKEHALDEGELLSGVEAAELLHGLVIRQVAQSGGGLDVGHQLLLIVARGRDDVGQEVTVRPGSQRSDAHRVRQTRDDADAGTTVWQQRIGEVAIGRDAGREAEIDVAAGNQLILARPCDG